MFLEITKCRMSHLGLLCCCSCGVSVLCRCLKSIAWVLLCFVQSQCRQTLMHVTCMPMIVVIYF